MINTNDDPLQLCLLMHAWRKLILHQYVCPVAIKFSLFFAIEPSARLNSVQLNYPSADIITKFHCWNSFVKNTLALA